MSELKFKVGDKVYITDDGKETGPYLITGEDIFGWWHFKPERNILPYACQDRMRLAGSDEPLMDEKL